MDSITAKAPTRAELAQFLPSEKLVRAFEGAFKDITTTLPQAVDTNSDAAAEALAQANTANAAAGAAQDAASAAQDSADLLATQQFVTVGAASDLPNSRALAVSAPLQLVDGGAGSTATLSLRPLAAILPADVSENAAAFVDATGLLLALAVGTYLVDGLLTFQSAATTTGIALAWTLPAGAQISGGYTHNVTTSGIEGAFNIAANSVSAATSGAPAIGQNTPINGRWLMVISTAGNAQLRFRSEVGASAVTLKAGLSAIKAEMLQ